MAAIEQYGGGKAAVSNSLPLFYVHGANGNNGDGSVNNPWGNFDLMIDFFEANPTILGGTVIVLGGTFNVTRNIYKGNSFFFYSGTKIIFNPPNTDSFLLQDTGGILYPSDFFFVGDVEIECNANFFDAGYYYSYSAQVNAGKKWTIDIAKLVCNGKEQLKLYGSINAYSIGFRELVINPHAVNSPLHHFIKCFKDERILSGEATIANAGCQLELTIEKCSLNSVATILQTGSGTYDYFGRYPKVKIKVLNIGGTTTRILLFRGKFNRKRKAIFSFEIDSIFNTREADGITDLQLIERSGINYGNENDIFFLFSGITFSWNTAFKNVDIADLFLPSSIIQEPYLYCIFKNCTIPDGKCLNSLGQPTTGAFIFQTRSLGDGQENCRSINGNIITVFNNENNSFCYSIVNN